MLRRALPRARHVAHPVAGDGQNGTLPDCTHLPYLVNDEFPDLLGEFVPLCGSYAVAAFPEQFKCPLHFRIRRRRAFRTTAVVPSGDIRSM